VRRLIFVSIFILIYSCSAIPSTWTPHTITSIISTNPTLLITKTQSTITSITVTGSKTPLPNKTLTSTAKFHIYEGNGNSIIDISDHNYIGMRIMKITYTGEGKFVISKITPFGELGAVIVNTMGSYSGIKPLDFMTNEQAETLKIESSGHWKIQILPYSDITQLEVPGVYSGIGDDVIELVGGFPRLMKIDASKAKSKFIIYDGRDILINENAPYSGEVILDTDPSILVISAIGNWSIEIV
jgi:hypothetical protein